MLRKKLTVRAFGFLPDALTEAVGIVGGAVENALKQSCLTSLRANLVEVQNSE